MNKIRLEEIRNMILAHPARLNMTLWFYTSHFPPGHPAFNPEEYSECGTVGCIAGWACILNLTTTKTRKGIYKAAKGITGKIFDYFGAAADILDLDLEEASRLFYAHNWPDPFQKIYFTKNEIPRERANITARRINHFIKTGL